MSWTVILANLAPLFLGLGAAAAFAWFLDALMGDTYRPSSGKDEEGKGESETTIGWRRGIVRLIGIIGIPMGILCFVSFAAIIFLTIKGQCLRLDGTYTRKDSVSTYRSSSIHISASAPRSCKSSGLVPTKPIISG